MPLASDRSNAALPALRPFSDSDRVTGSSSVFGDAPPFRAHPQNRITLLPAFPFSSLRKEVIQPHLPIRLPCYDFTPVADFTFGRSFPAPAVYHVTKIFSFRFMLRLSCFDSVVCFLFILFTTFPFKCLFGRRGVRSRTSGASNSHGVTGGVYKARERIHRDMLIRDY